MQSYGEYLQTMKSYRFYPLNKQGWINRQVEIHGFYIGDLDSRSISVGWWIKPEPYG